MSVGIARKNLGGQSDRRQANGAPAAKPVVLKLSQFIADHFTVRVRHRRVPSVKAAKTPQSLTSFERKNLLIRRRHLNISFVLPRRHHFCPRPPCPRGKRRNAFHRAVKPNSANSANAGFTPPAGKKFAGKNGRSPLGGE
jgi:hypothetical protein